MGAPWAKFEATLSGGVALWDVSAQLPRKEPQTRPLAGIKRVYVHHSGALGRPGVAGAVASATYSVTQRNFPSAAYHYWIPAESLYDDGGRIVVLRLVSDETRSWHTGGDANGHGLGVVLQGNTTAKPLTATHVECLEALLPWLRERYQLNAEWLSWHSDSGRFGGKAKATCPGKHAEEWLRAYRAAL